MHDAEIHRRLSGDSRGKSLIGTEQIRRPLVLLRTLGKGAVTSKNERVELAMQIMKYRQLMSRTTDEEFRRRAEEKILELEQKLREIDE